MRELKFLDNLIHVNRYSGNMLIKSESVSDHVWCMNALVLEYVPRLLEKYPCDIDIRSLIYWIALHDLDETLYCDIPRPFKHHNPEIETAIENTVNQLMSEKLPGMIYNDIKLLEDSSYHRLIKVFDVAQAGFKMISEIQLGNKYFIDELDNVLDCLNGLYERNQSESDNEFRKFTKALIDEFYNEFITFKSNLNNG